MKTFEDIYKQEEYLSLIKKLSYEDGTLLVNLLKNTSQLVLDICQETTKELIKMR